MAISSWISCISEINKSRSTRQCYYYHIIISRANAVDFFFFLDLKTYFVDIAEVIIIRCCWIYSLHFKDAERKTFSTHFFKVHKGG